MGDNELIRRAREGDEASLRLLRERVRVAVISRVRKLLRNTRRARDFSEDDVVNEIFLKLCERGCAALLHFDESIGSLEGYVGVLTKSRFIDYYRREKLRRERSLPLEASPEAHDAAASPEITAMHRDLAVQVCAHVAGGLPERGRIIFKMFFHEHRRPEEIARALGVTKQVVFNWIYQSRRLAKEFMEQQSKRKPDDPS
jgi:RNA polymerase sigma factor (sigma-70 family)